MRRGLIAVLVSLLLFPGSVFALEFNAPPALLNVFAAIGGFFEQFFVPVAAAQYATATPSAVVAAPSAEPVATVAEATTTPAAAPLPVPQPLSPQPPPVTRTVAQPSPLPGDLVHTSVLAGVLAAFQSKIDSQIAAITTPLPFPQQVAAGGNGVLSYGAAAAASAAIPFNNSGGSIIGSSNRGGPGNSDRTISGASA